MARSKSTVRNVIIVIIVIFALLIMGGIAIFFGFTEQSIVSSGSCIDSDNTNISTKGIVTYKGREYTDSCRGDFRVRENICKNNRKKSLTINCPIDYGCFDGACIPKEQVPPNCVDYDDGIDILNSSFINYKNKIYEDKCSGTTKVYEYYCQGDKKKSQRITCNSGQVCENGKCIGDITPDQELCSDSDNGITKDISGIVTYKNTRQYYDKCSSNRLREYYCENDRVKSQYVYCDSDEVCSEDRCVKKYEPISGYCDTSFDVTLLFLEPTFSNVNKDFFEEVVSDFNKYGKTVADGFITFEVKNYVYVKRGSIFTCVNNECGSCDPRWFNLSDDKIHPAKCVYERLPPSDILIMVGPKLGRAGPQSVRGVDIPTRKIGAGEPNGVYKDSLSTVNTIYHEIFHDIGFKHPDTCLRGKSLTEANRIKNREPHLDECELEIIKQHYIPYQCPINRLPGIQRNDNYMCKNGGPIGTTGEEEVKRWGITTCREVRLKKICEPYETRCHISKEYPSFLLVEQCNVFGTDWNVYDGYNFGNENPDYSKYQECSKTVIDK